MGGVGGDTLVALLPFSKNVPFFFLPKSARNGPFLPNVTFCSCSDDIIINAKGRFGFMKRHTIKWLNIEN